MREQTVPAEAEQWITCSLGNIASRITQRNLGDNRNVLTISARHGLVSQEGFFNRQVASADLSQYFRIERGDFAYNKSYSAGYPAGVVRKLELYDSGVVSPLYICFRVDRGLVDPNFLLHYFESGILNDVILDIAQEGVRNHGLLNVKVEDFFSLKLNIPGLGEQRRVVEILDEIDSQIATMRRVIEKRRIVRRHLLRRLVREGGYGKVPLSEISTIRSGSTPSRARDDYWKSGTVPWVTTSEINYSVITDTRERVTPVAVTETGLRIFPKGSVLIAMYGEGATRGRCAILGVDATTNQAAAAIVPDPASLDSAYLYYSLEDKYEDIRGIGHGSHQTNLNASMVGGIKIPVPAVGEQRKISTHLESFDAELGKEREIEGKYVSLKQALVNDLLSGRVRVPVSAER
ncbi:restriction endonuclease subunit S [Streptomyces sp. NPDC057474]|uniref:restriction endonuclease subunit S n=1 Tax=Streptomyces sp. NPDC057474 TaxID=3346144 RepID=UPI00369BD088